MKTALFICLLLLPFHLSCQNPDISEITETMDQQEKAWNKGDLTGFMEGYWKSDSLVFIGKSGITYGWQTTLESYRKGYPTKEKMGKLNFTLLKIDLISDEHAFVTGKWNLKRSDSELTGYFTLLWKKIDGRWLIVSDHSS